MQAMGSLIFVLGSWRSMTFEGETMNTMFFRSVDYSKLIRDVNETRPVDTLICRGEFMRKCGVGSLAARASGIEVEFVG